METVRTKDGLEMFFKAVCWHCRCSHPDFRASQETGVAQDCVVELAGLETARR